MLLRRLAACAALAGTVALTCATAAAAASRTVSHPYERVWPAAVRFLVVDEGLKVVDKDADTGYVVFELEDEGKTFRGALEVIRRTDRDRRPAVELVLRIDDRPSYMERILLDRLMRKLKRELGPEPAPPPGEPEPPDAGDDDDSSEPADPRAR